MALSAHIHFAYILRILYSTEHFKVHICSDCDLKVIFIRTSCTYTLGIQVIHVAPAKAKHHKWMDKQTKDSQQSDPYVALCFTGATINEFFSNKVSFCTPNYACTGEGLKMKQKLMPDPISIFLK